MYNLLPMHFEENRLYVIFKFTSNNFATTAMPKGILAARYTASTFIIPIIIIILFIRQRISFSFICKLYLLSINTHLNLYLWSFDLTLELIKHFSTSYRNCISFHISKSQAINGWAIVPPFFPRLDSSPIAFTVSIHLFGVSV